MLPNDCSKRLPRTCAEVLIMPNFHPDHAGFIATTAAEMKISKIIISNIALAKKTHPDGNFDKFKSRNMFRDDRWHDLYANRSHAGPAMSKTVQLVLSVAAT